VVHIAKVSGKKTPVRTDVCKQRQISVRRCTLEMLKIQYENTEALHGEIKMAFC